MAPGRSYSPPPATGRTGAPQGLVSCVAWRLGGRARYCLDGQVYAAASAVAWLAGLGLICDATELDGVAADDSGGGYSCLLWPDWPRLGGDRRHAPCPG